MMTTHSTEYQVDRGKRSARSKTSLFAGIAAGLAAAALVVQYRTRQAERDNPPLGKFIEVDGVRLHYIEHGQGQPVVLLHGNGTMAQELDISGLIDMVAVKYRVIAFDRPGYGYSERPRNRIWGPVAQAELLHHALQKLGIQQAIVVGHSWGTLVANALAMEFPSSVRSLVLLSGYYYPTVRADVPLLSPPALPVIGDLMRYTVSPLLGRAIWPAMLKRIFGPSPVPARFRRFPVWMALRPSQLRASAAETAMMIPSVMKLSRRYRELSMPVVIMAGADDRHVNVHRQSERLHQALPQSDLELVPGVGHMIHHVEQRRVLDAIDMAAREAATVHRIDQAAAVLH